ncbi:MAG: hypothetical protein E6R03_07220 [Hyphomicrobiaceae bacterium]|nr:MAG: hypothetical protein E6R03_07220 [Hyphomicrobiaceae bacterium]
MRRAGKKRIAQALLDYRIWRLKVDARLESIPPEGAKVAREWADDVYERIKAGDLGFCTSALSRSVVRVIEDFESGFYVGVTDNGGFVVRS